jgi:hypothetical protein
MNRARPQATSVDGHPNQSDIDFCLKHHKHVNQWEFKFLIDLIGYERPTEKQLAKLELVKRKVRTALRYKRGN